MAEQKKDHSSLAGVDEDAEEDDVVDENEFSLPVFSSLKTSYFLCWGQPLGNKSLLSLLIWVEVAQRKQYTKRKRERERIEHTGY